MSLVYRDKNGYPIQPGDLLKSFHYTDRKTRRKLYLYHTVTLRPMSEGREPLLWMVPACFIHTEEDKNVGKFRFEGACSVGAICYADGWADAEIVYSVGDTYWFERGRVERNGEV